MLSSCYNDHIHYLPEYWTFGVWKIITPGNKSDYCLTQPLNYSTRYIFLPSAFFLSLCWWKKISSSEFLLTLEYFLQDSIACLQLKVWYSTLSPFKDSLSLFQIILGQMSICNRSLQCLTKMIFQNTLMAFQIATIWVSLDR